jgi:hypothetical protein
MSKDSTEMLLEKHFGIKPRKNKAAEAALAALKAKRKREEMRRLVLAIGVPIVGLFLILGLVGFPYSCSTTLGLTSCQNNGLSWAVGVAIIMAAEYFIWMERHKG